LSFSYCFSFLTLGLLFGITYPLSIEIRRLRARDDGAVTALATYPGAGERPALLEDARTLLLAAFDGEKPVGFVLAYDLPRRHGDPSMLFVYEIEVDGGYRRRGIGTALMRRLEELARARGIREAFVLTEADNAESMPFYRSLGGRREDVVMWELEYTER
jgi:aminoglycoside 3-N-acetyltransferase I